jgi:hypothetical protein
MIRPMAVPTAQERDLHHRVDDALGGRRHPVDRVPEARGASIQRRAHHGYEYVRRRATTGSGIGRMRLGLWVPRAVPRAGAQGHA